VYHLILKGTVDEKILKALKHKESGQNTAIEALKLEVLGEVKK
jgi:SNF2 family DNA or RNA helicase